MLLILFWSAALFHKNSIVMVVNEDEVCDLEMSLALEYIDTDPYLTLV